MTVDKDLLNKVVDKVLKHKPDKARDQKKGPKKKESGEDKSKGK